MTAIKEISTQNKKANASYTVCETFEDVGKGASVLSFVFGQDDNKYMG
jgi:hypothetical protein